MRTRRSLSIALAMVLTSAGSLLAQQSPPEPVAGTWTAQELPELDVRRAPGPIRIDGDLGDPGWANAARATGFSEYFPDERARPPVESEALVTYDDRNLYVALIAHDDPATIRTRISDRDQIWQDDYFGILLDTYGDAAWAYYLFANPSGVQGDTRFSTSGGEDDGFDIVYASEARITADGYQVEMAIPFESLRFPSREEQVWRATFWRTRPRGSRAQYSWSAFDRGEQCFLCQFGTLKGIRGVEPGGSLELFPSVTASSTSALEDPEDPDGGFGDADVDGDASLGMRYAFPFGLTAEATVNPDFSQVESDVAQVDANTTFALFFPERRPFFQEGSDLFDSYFNVVYTRQINDPQAAVKLIGRLGRTNVAYLGARDEHSPLLLPFQERSFVGQARRSISNIIRARQTYGQNSYVGAMVTDRRFEDGDGAGTTYGVDGVHRFLDDWRLEYQFLGSRTVEPGESEGTAGLGEFRFDGGHHTGIFDGETFSGYAQYTSLEHTGRRWFSDFDYWASSPTFRADNGFEFRNDFRQVTIFEELNFYPDLPWIDQFTADTRVQRYWTYGGGERKSDFINPTLEFTLAGQTFVEVGYEWGRERFQGLDFGGLRQWTLFARSSASEKVQGGFFLARGRQVSRGSDPPILGEGTDLEVFGTLKPFQRLVVEPSINYSRLEDLEGNEIFSGYILRTRADLSVSRRLFLRLVAQFDDFDKQFNLEPLATYKINPFTLFYIGSTQVYRDFSEPRDGFAATERQYFAKFQYLFQM